MKTKRIIIGVAAAIVAATVAGCSSPTASGGGTKDLTFMVFETPSLTASFWDKSIATAEKAAPGVTIKKIVTPSADRDGYAKQLQASGQFPDILASVSAKDFSDAGLLAPFDKTWLEKNFQLPNGNAIEGKTYMPPTNSQINPLVFYNKKIFTDNNIDVPKDYAGFVAAVKKLKSAGVVPIELAGADGWSASMLQSAIVDADVLGKNPTWAIDRFSGDVKFTDPLFSGAMKKVSDLIAMKAFSPSALSVDFPTANTNFLAGKSGMYPMGSWFLGSSYITKEQAANIGVFTMPTDDGSVVVPFSTGGTTSVSTKSKDVKAAMTFAKAWSLAPENLSVLIKTDGAFPNMKNLSLDDFGVDVTDLYRQSYALVTDDTKKVDAFGANNNDNAFPSGCSDKWGALSQSLFSNNDLPSQLSQLDSDWDLASGK